MTEDIFATALSQACSGELALTKLIEAAARLGSAGQHAQARELYHAWIEHNASHPQLYVAYFNCSSLDAAAGDQAGAASALSEAIKQNEDFVPAYINLGRVYEECGATDRAVELWRAAVSRPAPINGNTVMYVTTALTQMARVLSAAHRSEEAEEAIRQCLAINPRQADILEQYTALLLAQCKWPVAVASEHVDRKTLVGGINPLSMAAYTDDPLLQLASAYRYVKRSAWDGQHDGKSDRRHAAIDLGNRRLRVGYVSSDLRDHAIGYLMAELFELHDKQKVEVFAYYCGPDSNTPLTNRIKSAVEHWADIRTLSDDEAAARVAADGIDILVDVNGHTRDSKTGLFARRAAPIQVNWLGYPGSMGSPYHQYLIADSWIIPPEYELYYSEKVVRLPCYQPNDRKRGIAAQRPTRESAGLPENAFVFCCFNGTHKISRFTFDRWMKVLGQVENSVLWLLDATDQTKARLRALAQERGVDGTRLIFAPKIQNSLHLARYPLADLFLDSAPYGAHTTASDALWMGVPVLTLSGRSFASRVCGSLVRSAGLPDLVCTDADAYVARAVALAGDPASISAYKAHLAANRDTCQLFDTSMLVSRLENLYRDMCEDHRSGRVPQPDLTNLDVYFDAGLDHDHDGVEMLRIADYHGLYREKLHRYDLARPLYPDTRLWRRDGHAPLGAAAPIQIMGASGAAPAPVTEITLARMQALLAAKTRGEGHDTLLDDVRAVIDPAIQCFNQLIAAGNIAQAALYADALADLLPGNAAALNSALSCNVALGRKQRATQVATALVGIDPGHEGARTALAANDAAMPAAAPLHPLIQLRDLYDQASSILCSPLTDGTARQVTQLRAAARKLEVDVPKDSEWAAWEKHYRMALKAIDVSATLSDTPKPADDAKITYATAAGKPLNWKAVQAAAKSTRAKAVFFAAADLAYVDLYGRAYVDSILEYSDVSSLIVLHVIGGAKTLPAIAKSLGISSTRLILSGDAFDAGSIKTKCYDAPPKGLSALPIAHLQSVRFLRVGSLLQGLKLPVFVSDIDLILQRGVADLLQSSTDRDLVLNENTASANAGSRFTANLLLLHPTKNTALFLRFLRAYLEKALGGSEVSRWIDQFAILQARHHLLRQAPEASIGYFDVSADINNLMYPSYQPHPYRFLSLYHGFDMSSLPGKAKKKMAAAVKTPIRRVAARR